MTHQELRERARGIRSELKAIEKRLAKLRREEEKAERKAAARAYKKRCPFQLKKGQLEYELADLRAVCQHPAHTTAKIQGEDCKICSDCGVEMEVVELVNKVVSQNARKQKHHC